MTDIQAPDGSIARFPDGMSDDAITAVMRQTFPPPSQPAAVNPFNRQLGADVSFGAPLQSPTPVPDLDRAGEIRAMLGGPITDRAVSAAQTLGGGDYGTNLAANRADTAAAQAAHPADSAAGAAAGAVPYGMLAPAGIAGAARAGAVAGAASSPDWSNVGQTALSAALGGGLGAGIGAGAKVAGKVITPFLPDANRLAMVDTLRDAGVTPTAGQTVGSRFVQGLEGPSEGGFTKAIMGAGGIPASDATQPSIAAARSAIGDQFDALGARNSVTIDDALRSDLQDAVANYKRLGGTSPGVETAASDLLSRNEPTLDGDAYNTMRSGFGKDAQTLRKSDPPQAQAYRDIQGALDDAMERSIAKNNPADIGAFREVRRQYGNFQDISKAASKLTGENAVAGTIPATRMQTVLSSGNKAPGYAAGQGDLAGLTRAGAGIMQPQAASVNPLARALLSHSVGGLAGAALGHLPGAGAFVRTPAVQAYIKNQFAPQDMLSPLANALAAGTASYSTRR